MAEPTIEQVFGAGASQTATTLTINKNSLLRLTASANNTAESLITAIAITAQQNLTEENFNLNLDQSIYITSGFPGFTNRGENNDYYRVDQVTINLARLDTSTQIDPDAY